MDAFQRGFEFICSTTCFGVIKSEQNCHCRLRKRCHQDLGLKVEQEYFGIDFAMLVEVVFSCSVLGQSQDLMESIDIHMTNSKAFWPSMEPKARA